MPQLQLEIPAEHVGRVVGLGGQQLKKFEASCACTYSIIRKGATINLQITAADPDTCAIGRRIVVDFMNCIRSVSKTTTETPPVMHPAATIPPPRPSTVSNVLRPSTLNTSMISSADPRVLTASSMVQSEVSSKTTLSPPSVPNGQRMPIRQPIPSAQLAAIRPPAPIRQPASTRQFAPMRQLAHAALPAPIRQTAPPVQQSTFVEIPSNYEYEVKKRLDDFISSTGCQFEIVAERNRTLVKIDHLDLRTRISARKSLETEIAKLGSQVDISSVPPVLNTSTPTTKTSSKAVNKISTLKHPPNGSLSGWNESVNPRSDNSTPKMGDILKDFYREHPEVTAMSLAEVEEFRKQNMDISVKALGSLQRPIPKPVVTFEHAYGNYEEIMRQLRAKFQKPSPIQSQAWPILLSGHDMIGIAQTGTGKTLAFLLPAFIHIDGQVLQRHQRRGAACLVISPTRELAQQIFEEAKKYSYKGLKCACLYGGGGRQEQMRQIRAQPDIIIATPGRLNELVELCVVSLDYVSYLVLDEADRMLDMGFEPQIRQIVRYVPSKRQTVMTSATWPTNVRRLAQSFLCDPIQISIGSLDLSAALTVTQRVKLVQNTEKFEILLKLMKSMSVNDRAIVFCGRKLVVDGTADRLRRNGIQCEAIHGDRDQRERENALKRLKSGSVRILIATDVASRGLDVPEITVVVNFDFPTNIEEYVHRVGRTGRAGRTGSSYTLMTMADARFGNDLAAILRKAKQQVPDWLYSLSSKRR